MRFTEISFAIPCALLLLTGAASNALGQQQQQPRPKTAPAAPAAAPVKPQPANQPGARPPQNNGPVVPAGAQVVPRQQRPAPEVLVVEELPPELEELLREWEAKSSLIKTLHGKHTRYVYNTVFEVEKRANGTFYLETPDKGRIDLVGINLKAADKSKRLGAEKTPYRLETDRSEKWICNGKVLFAVDDKEKTYELVPIPEKDQGKNIVNSPLPFLFGMKSADMKRRFRIHLDKNYKPKDEIAKLIVFPRQEIDQQNYSEAWIMLDKKTYLPVAVKLFDPTSSLETVYQFDDVKINAPEARSIRVLLFGGNEQDPFNPDFKAKGYKLVLPQIASNDQTPLLNNPNRQRNSLPGPGNPGAGSQAPPRQNTPPATKPNPK